MGQDGARARRVTLSDVAKHAGVSATTASFVLSGRTDMRISTATADRVHQSARILGYVPPLGSRLGPPQRMPALAFVSDTIATEPFAGEMIRGAVVAAAERGHSIVVAESQGAAGLEAGTLKDLAVRGVDRFVFATTATREIRLRPAQAETRTVLVNCVDPRSEAPALLPDDRQAGVRAVRTLLDAGHTDRIWLVGEISRTTIAARERRRGLVESLEARGLAFERTVGCSWWPPDARQLTIEALRRRRAPTAIVALNDRIAMGVYQAAADCGLSIPGDLSVIAFDNSDLAWWLHPGLTSLGLPYFEMGRRAVGRALGDGDGVRRELLPMPLHERESVGPPASLTVRLTELRPTTTRTTAL